MITALSAAGAAFYLRQRSIAAQKPKKLAAIFQPEEDQPRRGTLGLPLGRRSATARAQVAPKTEIAQGDVEPTGRNLALSVGMLSVITIGRLTFPIIGLASVPVLLYLNLPFLRQARQEVAEEGRVGIGVLDSTASLGMLALGDFFADALFLSLYYLSRKLLTGTHEQTGDAEIEATEISGISEQELKGNQMVDVGSMPMLAFGAVTWALLGATQAVAVLINYFGFDLRVVAPISVISYLKVAADRGIHIRDGRALEALQADDLLFVFDEAAAVRPEAQTVIDRLAGRGFTVIYTAQLTDPAESLPEDRTICFVGADMDNPTAQQAAVLLSWASAPAVAVDAAHIVLRQDSLAQLTDLLDLAQALERNEKVSFIITIVPAILCIAGIYVLNFGVVTAIILNYTGLGLGVLYALAPRVTDGLSTR